MHEQKQTVEVWAGKGSPTGVDWEAVKARVVKYLSQELDPIGGNGITEVGDLADLLPSYRMPEAPGHMRAERDMEFMCELHSEASAQNMWLWLTEGTVCVETRFRVLLDFGDGEPVEVPTRW